MADCNRRRFLMTGAGALMGLALNAGQSMTIDSHVHFYDPSRPQGVPWPSRDDRFLYRPMLPKDYRAIAVLRPVTEVIVVEASPWLADNQWVLDLAAHEPLIAGYVGYLPIGTKAFAENLTRLAVNRIFRGVRLRERRMDDTAFINDLKLLARYNLSLDLAGGMEILPFADRLAGKVPELRIIIDHLAGVAVDGKSPPRQWVDAMRKVARHPGVFCKLSGLVEGTGRDGGLAPLDVEFYRPVLDVMLTAFGLERLMYASNWPVSGRFAPMATVQHIISEYFRRFGSAAEEAVFGRTASAAYRMT